MQILEVVLADDSVVVHADSHLLQQSVDVGLKFLLSSFGQRDDHASSSLDILHKILQLMTSKWRSRSSQENEVSSLKGLLSEFVLVHGALAKGVTYERRVVLLTL